VVDDLQPAAVYAFRLRVSRPGYVVMLSNATDLFVMHPDAMAAPNVSSITSSTLDVCLRDMAVGFTEWA